MARTEAVRRIEVIGDSALAVLAAHGARGLTHRAVDEHAGLPSGSTSYYARTRAALLRLALDHVARSESAILGIDADLVLPGEPEALADLLADRLHRLLTSDPSRLLARYELAMEATRGDDLRAAYDAEGVRFQRLLTRALRQVGARSPARHSRALLGWSEGVLFRGVAGFGADHPPTRRELRATARDLLAGMVGPGRSPAP
ncbi:MAG TPA: TetR/AcrR family transcriptional regulator [Streptosporangiales bacterium]